MGEYILTQLVVVGWVLAGRVPACALGVGLGYKIIVSGDRAHEIAGIGYQLAVLCVLDSVIDVYRRILHLTERFHLVDVVESGHKAMSHKLVVAFVFIHDVALPVQEIGNLLAVVTFPFVFVRWIRYAVAFVEFFPCVYVHAPVVHAPFFCEQVEVAAEFVFYVVAETDEIVAVVDASGFKFVIHLIAYDSRMFGVSFHHFPYDAFAIETEGRVGEVHVLAYAIMRLFTVHLFG